MRIRLAIPDHLVTPQLLEAALEATTLANQAAIENGEVPLATEAISKGVQWQEEPFGDGEHFDLAHQVEGRRWGDCDDLAPWLAAELRATGEDPGARTRILRTGKSRFHAVTETSDGEILDPSRWAGMGRRSAPASRGVSGAIAKPFAHLGCGGIVCAPTHGGWRARCDVPFGDLHLASHATARSADRAVERAINGALACGEHYDMPVERLITAGELLLGDARDVTISGAGPMKVAKKEIKAWTEEMKAKGYSRENPPPEQGPDSLHEWLLAKGWQRGNATSFGSALKGAGRIVAPIASAAIPGASTLTALTKGMGLPNPIPAFGGMVEHAPNGAIAVPLESPDAPGRGHAFIMYHPLGAPGPVVMRF